MSAGELNKKITAAVRSVVGAERASQVASSIQDELALAEFVVTGRLSFGPRAQEILRAMNRHPNYPRICLSCGARESLDGSLPCGH